MGLTPFACVSCDYKGATRAHLIQHSKIHATYEKPFKCSQCPYKTDNKYRLRSHMDRHEGIKNINCNSCEYRTNDSGHLKEHRRRVHENQKLKCKDCDFECKASSSMHFHKNKYHLQVAKKFPCNECSYVAPRQHGLTMHMRSKHENIQLVCDLCTKSYKSESGLKHHKNEEHSESTPPRYPCDQCSNGKHYKTKLNLQRHIEATHEMRKHICETCDSQFATQSGLWTHTKRIHEGRRFECDLCGCRAATKDSLQNHMRLKHRT